MKRAATQQKRGMRTLTISISLPVTAKVTERQATELLVLKLVDEGVLSQSQAADLLGVSRYNLIELMSRHQIPVMRYSSKDWSQENRVLEELQAQRRKTQSS
jgi:predicted HTH domain antitoxin